ncbi:hypothetical protein [Streptacidiphilus jiangxiensis]|uniref:Uncharacterized protein n=1 Tax=Streptacidiphilus jiangxiensis TaxID=235985 RepID=A0A1H8ANN0_STRJI|nr:hypothetical protein [Streptacidiphilus jiangxiensis]SEM72340.1 hypothetical protein SAMN05414137_1486 [Streptacidiphilus jiangxiensis]
MTVVDIINSVLGAAAHAPQLAHSASAAAAANLPGIVLVTVPLLAALAAGQVLLARRALADRAGVEFLPGPGFEPGEEDILRFAHQLARAQASASRWHLTPRRATAVRIRLTSSGGPPSFRVEARTRTLALISRHAYVGCQVRDPEQEVTAASGVTITFEGPADLESTGVAA